MPEKGNKNNDDTKNDTICINREIWNNIPPNVKSLHASLYKPFYVRTRYSEVIEGILVGALWELAEIQIMAIDRVYDPGCQCYKERWILKTVDGKMIVEYGEIKREEYIEPHEAGV